MTWHEADSEESDAHQALTTFFHIFRNEYIIIAYF